MPSYHLQHLHLLLYPRPSLMYVSSMLLDHAVQFATSPDALFPLAYLLTARPIRPLTLGIIVFLAWERFTWKRIAAAQQSRIEVMNRTVRIWQMLARPLVGW